MIITIDQIIAARGCYSEARVFEISAGRTEITLMEICDLPIPELDRVYLASQFLTDRHERHLRCDYAQAVAHISTDPRVHRAIDTARRYADGNATDDELLAAARAACAAACAAERAACAAERAACAAACAAARASWEAACASWEAACAAARAACAAACAAARASWEAACASWEAACAAAWAAAARAADESQTIDIIGILRERIETQEAE